MNYFEIHCNKTKKNRKNRVVFEKKIFSFDKIKKKKLAQF